MTRYILILLLASLCLAASYHEGETFTLDGDTLVNVTVAGGRAFLTSDYYQLFIRAGDCDAADVYRFCVESIEENPVAFYPHRFKVNLTREKLCDDCSGYGGKCETNTDCQGACVHSICRPNDPWCGDGICDAVENGTCEADCPLPEEPESPEEAMPDATSDTNATVNDTMVNDTLEVDGTNTSGNASDGSVVSADTGTEEPTEPVADPDNTPPSPVADEQDVNWLGVGLTGLVGLAGITFLFSRRRKPRI